MFHKLAESCANLLVGTPGPDTSRHAWAQVYRALNHGVVAKGCADNTILTFPDEVQDFAFLFRSLQNERERCDYQPDYVPPPFSAVEAKIEQARKDIQAFDLVPEKDRRAFAIYILLDSRRHKNAAEPKRPMLKA